MSQEFAWDAQRRRAQEQRSMLQEVRRRDRDACRVCGVAVSDDDCSLNYRILRPGIALTMDGVAVVCRGHLVNGLVLAPGTHTFRIPLVPAAGLETGAAIDESAWVVWSQPEAQAPRPRRWWEKFFRSRRFHHRAKGPVVIDSDRREIIHIFGRKP